MFIMLILRQTPHVLYTLYNSVKTAKLHEFLPNYFCKITIIKSPIETGIFIFLVQIGSDGLK